MVSLSNEIGLRALREFSGAEVKYFHQVVFIHSPKDSQDTEDETNGTTETNQTNNQTSTEPGHYPLVYFCLTKGYLLLIDVNAMKMAYLSKFPNSLQDVDTTITATTNTVEGETSIELTTKDGFANPTSIDAPPPDSPYETARISYASIHQLLVYAEREDYFGVVLTKEDPLQPPEVFQFSSMYRKAIIEELQVCYNTYQLVRYSIMANLQVRFLPLPDQQNQQAVSRFYAVDEVRHPAVQFYERLKEDKLKDKRLFYRCGYLFLAPWNVEDQYPTLHNRPCSTYRYNIDKKQISEKGNLTRERHLVVRFLPPQNISSSTIVSADAKNQSSLSEFRNLSELEFRLWTESVAASVAMRESEDGNPNSDYMMFREAYRKKLNVVGDKASWSCFKIHIFTRSREIGVIGVRRKFIPPFLDVYQDILFILYGDMNSLNFEPESNFMQPLEDIVDSLSPSVGPRPFCNSGLSVTQGANTPELTSAVAAALSTVHRTYYDLLILQARADTLLFSQMMFAWLKSRSDLGIYPRTKFIDKECYQLAKIFCRSILAKVGVDKSRRTTGEEKSDKQDDHPYMDERKEEEEEKDDEKDLNHVENPLTIIFRMEAELSNEESKSRPITLAPPDGSTDTADSLDLDEKYEKPVAKIANQSETELNVMKEEWKNRLARYFAYCVDGGIYPNSLTIKKLVEAISVETKMTNEIRTIDRVIDFLLHMKKKESGGIMSKFQPVDHIMQKVGQPEFLRSFTCNEEVMCKLLQTQYIENLEQRLDPQQRQLKDRQSKLPELLEALLFKDYNLELIRSVCLKIRSIAEQKIPIGSLVAPLIQLIQRGNVYSKIYAFQSLSLMAINDAKLIVKNGGLSCAVNEIYRSKNGELLEASIHFITKLSQNDKDNILSTVANKSFIQQLVKLLEGRYGVVRPIRHHPKLLAEVCSLILKLSSQGEALKELLSQHCIERLMEIIKKYREYDSILVKVSAALGTLFVNAGTEVKQQSYAKEHASVLVETLKTCATMEKLQIALNILIAIRYIIRADVIGKESELQPFREKILLHICQYHSFETVLRTISETIDTLREKQEKSDIKDEYGGYGSEHKEKQQSWKALTPIVNGVGKKVTWFLEIIAQAKKNNEKDWKRKQKVDIS